MNCHAQTCPARACHPACSIIPALVAESTLLKTYDTGKLLQLANGDVIVEIGSVQTNANKSFLEILPSPANGCYSQREAWGVHLDMNTGRWKFLSSVLPNGDVFVAGAESSGNTEISPLPTASLWPRRSRISS